MADGIPPVPDNGPWATPQGMPLQSQAIHDTRHVGTFFRSEWLSLTIQEPGRVLLGSQVGNISNPFAPFNVEDEFGFPIGTAQIPNLLGVKFHGVNGWRNTLGFEYESGRTLELSGFVTENAVSRLGNDTLSDENLYATSVLINGNVSDGLDAPNLLFYNRSYLASYSSRIWGGEINLVMAPSERAIFQWRPLMGLRYVNLTEKIQQRGVFQPSTILDPAVETSIDTWAYNSTIVAQGGFRLETVGKYFTLGMEPKIGFGPNFAMAKVRTDHLRGLTDGVLETTDLARDFSAVMDIGGYLRWHATENLTFSLGYTLTYVSNVIRGSTSTYYNDTGDLSQPPGVVASAQKSDIYWRGLTLGGELKW